MCVAGDLPRAEVSSSVFEIPLPVSHMGRGWLQGPLSSLSEKRA